MTIGSFSEKKKINSFIEEYNMISKGDGVVIGLSGGPDSVCLFFVMESLKEKYDLTLRAVHVNHCIRGKAADRDEEFVGALCAEHEIPLTVVKVDVPLLAKESGRSLEEEARLVRYEAFETAANSLEKEKRLRAVQIAVAHNADDNAETVLFHMARGAGLEGMCGIQPKRGRIIRPLLMVSKAEILDWLRENEISFCNDDTNADVTYDRNRIRHMVIPELTEVNDGVVEHISNMTSTLRLATDYIGSQVRALLDSCSDDLGLDLKKLESEHPYLRQMVIKEYLSGFRPGNKDVAMSHILACEELIKAAGEKRVSLPHGKCALISYGWMTVVKEEKKEAKPYENCVKTRIFEANGVADYPRDTYTKWFDYDKIATNIVIRTRLEGDYLTINAAGQKKSLQNYLVNEKVPKHLRDEIPLVCDGNHVLWVVGHRISEYYKVTANTTHILEIIYGGNNNE